MGFDIYVISVVLAISYHKIIIIIIITSICMIGPSVSSILQVPNAVQEHEILNYLYIYLVFLDVAVYSMIRQFILNCSNETLDLHCKVFFFGPVLTGNIYSYM